jgi:septum site-determining protein MinD
MSRLIAVVSGKGGVGKTTLSAALGAELARQGKKVLLLDGDLGLSNMDLILGAEDRVKYTIYDFALGKCFPEDSIISLNDHLDFIAGTSDVTWDNAFEEAVETVLEDTYDRYDIVILDCPAGMGKGLEFARRKADEAVAVLAPAWPSLRDVERILQFFSGEVPAGVVMNQFSWDDDTRVSAVDMYSHLDPESFLGVVPYSREAARLANQGQILSCDRNKPFGKAIALVAGNLERRRHYPPSRWTSLLQEARENDIMEWKQELEEELNQLKRRQSRQAWKWGRRRR